MEMNYLVVMERGDTGNWGAYVPDLPGCTAVGSSEEEATELIKTSIDLWIETAIARGWPVPEPSSTALTVAVRPPAA